MDEEPAKWPLVVSPILLVVCIVALIVMAAWPSWAQQRNTCGPIETLRAELAKRYGEVEVGVGMIDQDRVLTLFSSPDGESWTMLSVSASGIACVISAGTVWTPRPLPKAPVEGRRDS